MTNQLNTKYDFTIRLEVGGKLQRFMWRGCVHGERTVCRDVEQQLVVEMFHVRFKLSKFTSKFNTVL